MPARTILPLLLGVLALGVGVPPGAAQSPDPSPPTVAVLDFTGFMMGESGNSVNLGKAVSAMLITEFSLRDDLRVIERARLNDLLTEQRLALSGRVDESSASEIGRLLGARYVIHGQVTSLGPAMRMDIRAVDVETSEIVAVLRRNDQTEALLSAVEWVAGAFATELELETPSSAEAPAAPVPVRATIEFSRALDFEDQGEKERAIEQYRKVLELHPPHREARAALQRLTGGEG